MSFNHDEKPATKQADVRDRDRSNRSINTRDLLSSERIFLSGIQHLAFGRVEGVRISGGELVLDPWPTVIQHVKFGGVSGTESGRSDTEFQLKKPLADFFAHIRSIDKGVIRSLAIHRGLPISMELMLPIPGSRSSGQGQLETCPNSLRRNGKE